MALEVTADGNPERIIYKFIQPETGCYVEIYIAVEGTEEQWREFVALVENLSEVMDTLQPALDNGYAVSKGDGVGIITEDITNE